MRGVRMVALLAFAVALATDLGAVAWTTGPSAAERRPVHAGAEATWRPRVGAGERYASERAGDTRFAIVDLGGEHHKFHAGRSAPMASLFKPMLLAAYLSRHSVRDRDLREADRELLDPMITRSDDAAATTVRDIVGRERIERLAEKAGMRHFRYDEIWGRSRTSARDQMLFFYKWDRYVPERHEEYARELLASIVESQRWGIADERPPGWRLYFKGGWGTGTGLVDHQVAFLERHECRIALAIITEFNPSHDYGIKTLREVADRLLRGLGRGDC
jgi:Beta-lactamase enzyme family